MQNRNRIQEGVLVTSDELRAAALLSFNIKLVNAETSHQGNRLVFVFSDEDGAARLASACFLQDRQVGIQTFCNNLRKIRELIYQWRLSGEGEKHESR